MTLKPALAISALIAALSIIPAQTRGSNMSKNQACFKEYPHAEASAPSWDIEAVETAWRTPIGSELFLVGGIDNYGWARACHVADAPADIFEGEYRDRTTWYRGRFRLETMQGAAAAPDAPDRFYISHYAHPDGLVLYPINEGPPPVETLRLRPIDPEGFATKPPM